ncbi:MAG: ABC transporter substrate-binding protein [Lachnospiraceae bacterium]|nr:ABC transporter substrate-binding protein [Lachnospiraceae bacterium]
MKKKVLAVFMALVFALSFTAACGSQQDSTTKASEASTAETKESAATAESTKESDTTTPEEKSTEAETSSETEPASEEKTTEAETSSETEPASEETTTESEEASSDAPADTTDINIGVLKGPTGMGAIKLMDDSENGVYPNYHFTLTPEVTDIVARLSNGDLNIGALPTNVAANLYNKTSGNVEIIAINCLGVLYILENGDSVKTVEDLKGRTLYCNGQGSNPEFMINYVLRQHGLEPGKDVDVKFEDASVISQKMISGEIDLCMLPVPAVTTIMLKNQDVKKALDMTKEYADAANNGSVLTMGCLAARKDFIEAHPEAVDEFLKVYAESVDAVLADVDASAELIAKYEITGNAQIAKLAIPDASIVCITGDQLKPALEGYFQVLYDADPASVGGTLPGDDFYYVSEK